MKHMMSVYYGIWYTMVYYGIMMVKSWWDYYGKMIAFDDGCFFLMRMKGIIGIVYNIIQ